MATQIRTTVFRSFDATDINIILNALSVQDSENQEFLEKKLATLEALKEFSIKYIDIESMSLRESKAAYIRFLSKITENIETLEILTGKITVEQIKAASQSFARKWDSAVGIID
jgi:hypothetical protein